jgi:uncharacterized protein
MAVVRTDQFESFSSGSGAVFGRLFPGADLVGDLVAACHAHGLKQGYIASLIGSLKETNFVYVRPNPDSPTGIKYGDPLSVPGPVEILTASGMLGVDDEGAPSMHMHIMFVDVMGHIHGGHILERGNPTLITVEFAIEPMSGGTLVRKVDQRLGFPLFNFTE